MALSAWMTIFKHLRGLCLPKTAPMPAAPRNRETAPSTDRVHRGAAFPAPGVWPRCRPNRARGAEVSQPAITLVELPALRTVCRIGLEDLALNAHRFPEGG